MRDLFESASWLGIPLLPFSGRPPASVSWEGGPTWAPGQPVGGESISWALPGEATAPGAPASPVPGGAGPVEAQNIVWIRPMLQEPMLPSAVRAAAEAGASVPTGLAGAGGPETGAGPLTGPLRGQGPDWQEALLRAALRGLPDIALGAAKLLGRWLSQRGGGLTPQEAGPAAEAESDDMWRAWFGPDMERGALTPTEAGLAAMAEFGPTWLDTMPPEVWDAWFGTGAAVPPDALWDAWFDLGSVAPATGGALTPAEAGLAATAEYGPTGAEAAASGMSGLVSPASVLAAAGLIASLLGEKDLGTILSTTSSFAATPALMSSLSAALGPTLGVLLGTAAPIVGLALTALMYESNRYAKHRQEAAEEMQRLVPRQLARIAAARTPEELARELQPWNTGRIMWTGSEFGGGYEAGEQFWPQVNPQVSQLIGLKQRIFEALADPTLPPEARTALQSLQDHLKSQAVDLAVQSGLPIFSGMPAVIRVWPELPEYNPFMRPEEVQYGQPVQTQWLPGVGLPFTIGFGDDYATPLYRWLQSQPFGQAPYERWMRATPDPWDRARQLMGLDPFPEDFYVYVGGPRGDVYPVPRWSPGDIYARPRWSGEGEEIPWALVPADVFWGGGPEQVFSAGLHTGYAPGLLELLRAWYGRGVIPPEYADMTVPTSQYIVTP